MVNNIPLDIIGERRFENMYYRLRDQKPKNSNANFYNERGERKPSIKSNKYKDLSPKEKIVLLEK